LDGLDYGYILSFHYKILKVLLHEPIILPLTCWQMDTITPAFNQLIRFMRTARGRRDTFRLCDETQYV